MRTLGASLLVTGMVLAVLGWGLHSGTPCYCPSAAHDKVPCHCLDAQAQRAGNAIEYAGISLALGGALLFVLAQRRYQVMTRTRT